MKHKESGFARIAVMMISTVAVAGMVYGQLQNNGRGWSPVVSDPPEINNVIQSVTSANYLADVQDATGALTLAAKLQGLDADATDIISVEMAEANVASEGKKSKAPKKFDNLGEFLNPGQGNKALVMEIKVDDGVPGQVSAHFCYKNDNMIGPTNNGKKGHPRASDCKIQYCVDATKLNTNNPVHCLLGWANGDVDDGEYSCLSTRSDSNGSNKEARFCEACDAARHGFYGTASRKPNTNTDCADMTQAFGTIAMDVFEEPTWSCGVQVGNTYDVTCGCAADDVECNEPVEKK